MRTNANALEMLESRQLLSGSGDIWKIQGDRTPGSPDDTIIIEPSPTAPRRLLRVMINGQLAGTHAISSLMGIVVDAGEGNDFVRIRPGKRFVDLPVTVFGGDGDDVLIGGATKDTLYGGPGNDRLDGRGGHNLIDGQAGDDQIIRHSEDRIHRVGNDRFVASVLQRMIAHAATSQPASPVTSPADPIVLPLDPQPIDPISPLPPADPTDPVDQPIEELPAPQPLDLSAADSVAEAINQFAFAFYRKLVAQHAQDNQLFSPYSLVSALSMLLPAARGDTLAEMLQSMCLPQNVDAVMQQFKALNADLRPAGDNPAYTLDIANAFWHTSMVQPLPRYLQDIQQAFAAVADTLDLTNGSVAAPVVNQWADDHTQGMIKQVVTPSDFNEYTRILLANAVYFKGTWANTFAAEDTQSRSFHLADGTSVLAPIMYQQARFKFYRGQGFSLLEIPYADGRMSMVALLPEGADQLDDLTQAVTPEQLTSWLSAASVQDVQVSFPRFEFSTVLGAADNQAILRSLGMNTAFDNDADFSGLDPEAPLTIDKVIQAARIEVTEEGTRAAAVTVVIGVGNCVTPCQPPKVFNADHPFMFAIRDMQTGTIQFMGQVTNPVAPAN